MNKSIAISFLLVFMSLTSAAKVWTLSDANITLDFDDQTALIKITDKRCNKVWEQFPFAESLLVKKVEQKDKTLTVTILGNILLKAVLTLTDASDLEVKIQANEKLPVKDFSFPSAFKSPNKNHYALLTNTEGVLLPVDDTNYILINERMYFCGGGLSMSWMGVTDFDFKTGYMAILETPYDGNLITYRKDGQVVFKPSWLPSLEKFGYERKVRYIFLDKGGYVAQCKKYREYIWKKNQVITLRENQKKTPALDKMMGVPHIYLWNDARQVSFAQEMKSSGIDKALILWDANHRPYPEIGYDNKLKELGYATGAYELFTDLKLKDTATYAVDENGPMRFSRTTYPRLFNDMALRYKSGKTESNQFGHTICPATIRPEMIKRVERELKEFPHETYFLDVWAANGVFECYSPKHPLTRQQFAEEVNKNHKFLAGKYNLFLGGEWGADYIGSNSVYVHGMMTLQTFWWGNKSGKKGGIYSAGDWRNNESPSAMVGTRVASDYYLKYCVNEAIRVPLYELVYHDAMVTSWRWEDGNHNMPEIWWKKDLFNVLYGSVPLWSMDRNRWNEYKQTFIESYKTICPWLQQIGYDELVSHRFVSNDHKVQESVFSLGKKVVVNFGDVDYVFEGRTIKAKGFLIH